MVRPAALPFSQGFDRLAAKTQGEFAPIGEPIVSGPWHFEPLCFALMPDASHMDSIRRSSRRHKLSPLVFNRGSARAVWLKLT